MTQSYGPEAWARACRNSLLRSQERRARPRHSTPRVVLAVAYIVTGVVLFAAGISFGLGWWSP